MLTASLLYAILLGIAGWIPAPTDRADRWLGFRFFHAGTALIVVLYVGNVVLAIPLSALAVIIGIAAAGGIVAEVWRERGRRLDSLARQFHPILVLALLVAAVAAARGGISYLPYPGDEVASWLRLARQIFLVDAYWSGRIDYHLGAYTNGWPLLVAFANTLRGSWEDGNAALLPFLLHLGLLGLLYDLVRYVADKRLVHAWKATAFTWLCLLSFLTIEASWILVPRFLLVDEPLSYAYLGCLVTAIVGLEDSTHRMRLAGLLGIGIAAGYLLKIAMLAALPALGLLVLAYLWLDADERLTVLFQLATARRALSYVVMTLGPLALIAVTWSVFKTGEHCNASPISLLMNRSDATTAAATTVLQLYGEATREYIMAFKLPVSLAAAVGFAFGLVNRRLAWVVVAIIVFLLTHSAAHFVSYLSCFDVFTEGQLWSFQRYFRQNHRVLHVMGPLVFVLWALKSPGMQSMILDLREKRSWHAVIIVAIGALMVAQIWAAERSLRDLATRELQDPLVRDAVIVLRNESDEIRRIISRENLSNPSVSIVAQGGYGVEFELAGYFGIKNRREPGPLFLYTPLRPYSWSGTNRSAFNAVATPDELEIHWREFDIIWPIRLDGWTKAVLARLADGPACAADPQRFFFVKTNRRAFRCILKGAGAP